MSEHNLIKACIENEPLAQRVLYDTYIQSMYNTVYRYCKSKEDCEDILQIAFTKIFKKLDSYDPTKGTLISWIRTICIRTSINYHKRYAQHFVSTTDINDQNFEIDLNLEAMDAEYLLDIIERLPTTLKMIFFMHEIDGYKHHEISEMTGINMHSSRVYLARAKKKLRDLVNQYHSNLKISLR